MFSIDFSELDQVSDLIKQYPGKAQGIVTNILHNEGAEEIKREIALLLPSSGRHWKRKAAPASVAMPGKFSQANNPTSVIISTKGRYRYLYFPDDGSNTKRHAGNQHFMMHGAENASSRIIDLCIGKLMEEVD